MPHLLSRPPYLLISMALNWQVSESSSPAGFFFFFYLCLSGSPASLPLDQQLFQPLFHTVIILLLNPLLSHVAPVSQASHSHTVWVLDASLLSSIKTITGSAPNHPHLFPAPLGFFWKPYHSRFQLPSLREWLEQFYLKALTSSQTPHTHFS